MVVLKVAVWLHDKVNILNATELYLTVIKMVYFMLCIFATVFKKKNFASLMGMKSHCFYLLFPDY